jgi:hypothetical protein
MSAKITVDSYQATLYLITLQATGVGKLGMEQESTIMKYLSLRAQKLRSRMFI